MGMFDELTEDTRGDGDPLLTIERRKRREQKNRVARRQRCLYAYIAEYFKVYGGFPSPTELKGIWDFIHYK
jgi:hypothetical protein